MACAMEGVRKILLCTDGSEFSEGAVREAIGLAKSCSAMLYAVAVAEVNSEHETIAMNLVEKEGHRVAGILDAVKARAAAAGVECKIIIGRSAQPHLPIVEEAAKLNADVIVTGRRGKTGLERLLMGSVTAKVIGHAPCNVLVVPRAARVSGRSILVAVDGSKWSEAASAMAVRMAKGSGARLHAIAVIPAEALHPMEDVSLKVKEKLEKDVLENEAKRAEENIAAVKQAASGAGLEATGVIYTGRPYEAIVEEAGKDAADVIVMGSHGRTGLKKFLMGSVAERVIGLAECAVLVVRRSGGAG